MPNVEIEIDPVTFIQIHNLETRDCQVQDPHANRLARARSLPLTFNLTGPENKGQVASMVNQVTLWWFGLDLGLGLNPALGKSSSNPQNSKPTSGEMTRLLGAPAAHVKCGWGASRPL